MPRVAYIVRNPYTFNSFSYVARVLSIYYPGDILPFAIPTYRNIVVGDLVFDMNLKGDIYWMDTPLVPRDPSVYRGKTIYVTSAYNKELLHSIGVDDVKVVGRILHPLFLLYSYPGYVYKDIDVLVVGYRDPPDRKNLDKMYEIITRLNLEYVAITNYTRYTNRYDFGSLDEYSKLKLYQRSRFLLHLAKNGGFEMTVWESMCSGTIPITLDIPVFSQLPIPKVKPAFHRVEKTIYGDMEVWDVDIFDAVDEVKRVVGQYQGSSYDSMASMLRQYCLERQLGYLKLFYEEIISP